MDDDCAERARQALYQVVEAEYEALGGNNNDHLENADEGEAEEGSSSILQNLRKRICRDRERHVEVLIGILLTRDQLHFSQDANATVRSTVEAYLRLPLEEFRCLRFILAQH